VNIISHADGCSGVRLMRYSKKKFFLTEKKVQNFVLSTPEKKSSVLFISILFGSVQANCNMICTEKMKLTHGRATQKRLT
jgi:hypothetical protein